MQSLTGTGVALVTPFKKDFSVDTDALTKIVNYQVDNGINYLVVLGTTAESATLNKDEKELVIKTVIEANAGRLPLVLGVGGNNTHEVTEELKSRDLSAFTAILSVSPYYNKPNEAGQVAHYQAVADATDLPVIIYNIPGRSVIDIADDTILKIADICDNVIGVKDATGDLARVATLKHRAGDRLALLSGEDMTALAFNSLGGQGCISVSANAAPAECAALQTASLNFDYRKAQDIHNKLVNLHEAMFCETSPAPVKYAMSRMGKCENLLRLPLVPASDIACERMDMALFELGII